MKTVTILVGNSDNKLSQYDWAAFVIGMNAAIRNSCHDVHFHGSSLPFDPWQNAAWVVGLPEIPGKLEELKRAITFVRLGFRQESAAVVVGETEFV